MKKYLKRLLSMMMAVLLCFGIVPSNAFAAEYEYDGYISMIDYNGRGYSLSSSLPAPFGGYSTDKFTELRINDLTAFRTAYCIQLGVATHTGIGYDQSDDYAALTTEQKAMINTALTLGYNVETGTKYGGSAMDEYIATQILIWLIAHGQLGTGYENQIVNEITANSPAAKTIFQKLRENVVTYHTVPSFATDNPSAVGAYTHDLKYNEDTGKNETTLVDENNVLKDFSVSYPGVDFSISGNKLHVSTDKKEFGTITAEKELPSSIPGVVTGGTKYWLRDEYQNVVTFDVKGSAEPVKCYFSLEIKAGTLQLVKTSEDGEVSGIPFHISGNGIEKDVVTGPDGSIRVDNLQAGTYTVTERAPDKYVQPESKQVTIYPGQTSSVSFSNLLKKFTVKLDKVDSETEEAQGDSSLDGALYGMFKGENLLDTYTTANGGKFTTKEYPCGSDYTIREITPSEGYLLDETIYPVGAEPGNFTLENNSIPMTATEDVKEGHFAFRYKNFLGYRPGENGEPEIDPEQATIVSRIFFAFLSGDTPEQIAKSLEADHIPSPTGKPTWSKTTIRNMLQNEKYAGDVLLQKTYTADFLEKKVKKNRGEVKQYYITDNHPAIIPRDIFQEVQLEIARRSSKRKVSCRRTKSGRGKYTSKYALSERTVCGECGAMYRRTMWIKRDRTKEDVWRCVNRLEFGTKYCKHSPSLKEPILHQAILNCIQSVFHNKEEIAEAVREAQKKIILFEDAKNNPEVIRQRMQDIDHGMANLLTLAAQSSQIELFEKKFKEMTEEKARLTEQLKQAEEDATTDAKRQKQLDDILKAIDIDIVELTEFDDTFIRRIVEQVTILSKDKIEVRFIGGFSKVGDIPTK